MLPFPSPPPPHLPRGRAITDEDQGGISLKVGEKGFSPTTFDTLKGQCHVIDIGGKFAACIVDTGGTGSSVVDTTQALESPIRAVSIFFENSR